MARGRAARRALQRPRVPAAAGRAARSAWTCARRSSSRGSTARSTRTRSTRLRAAGHEVACHGWRHEPWHGVYDERERLARTARRARQPGRLPPARRPPQPRDARARCASSATPTARRPARAPAPRRHRRAAVPLGADRRLLLPAALRGAAARNGDPEAPMEPAVLRERVLAALDAHTDGHLALMFHPFLIRRRAVDVLAGCSSARRARAWGRRGGAGRRPAHETSAGRLDRPRASLLGRDAEPLRPRSITSVGTRASAGTLSDYLRPSPSARGRTARTPGRGRAATSRSAAASGP